MYMIHPTDHPVSVVTRAFFLFTILTMGVRSAHAQDALCYTEQRYCEKGFLGTRGDTRLFYEVWTIPVAAGPSFSAIVLLTDTNRLADSLDFCLDVTHRSDTVFVSITRGDTTRDYVATKPLQVPTVYQPLTVKYGYQRMSGLNKKDGVNKVNLNDDALTLTYLDGPRLGNNELVVETYRWAADRFVLFDTKRAPY